MANRLVPTVITIFWVVMTSALVRMEYFPAARAPVPMNQVLDQVFKEVERTERFSVSYRGEELGMLDMHLGPSATRDISSSVARSVTINGNLDLKSFGLDARLRLGPIWATLDERYDIEAFSIETWYRPRKQEPIGVTILGTGSSPKLHMKYTMGEGRTQHSITAEGEGFALVATLAKELGLKQFSMLHTFLNVVGGPNSGGSTGLPSPTIESFQSTLVVQGVRQPMFVIEARSTSDLWTKAWITRNGQIVLIETSADLLLKNVEVYPTESTATLAVVEPRNRSETP